MICSQPMAARGADSNLPAPMPFDSASLGFPVELGAVSRELKKLWESDGESKTRASLLNFVVYSEGVSNLESNTTLISQLVREHACRAILVAHCADETPAKISAWIQAHCHLTKAGAKQVCSEQITLLAEGVSEESVIHAFMANLDYDLPLCLWWQPEFPQNPTHSLWNWVDRLLFDSARWTAPAEQLHRLHRLKSRSGAGMALSDLNWTRCLSMRQAIAQCADRHIVLRQLQELQHLEITHASGFHSTAQLIACWMAAQLQWTVASYQADSVNFRMRSGATVQCTFVESQPSGGPAVSSVKMISPDTTLSLHHEPGNAPIVSHLSSPEGVWDSRFYAGSESLESLISEEMNPGIHHRVYLKALALWQTLF
jgi:glucose-6-phosphate dehydrogenase assembly protein OpcA